MKNTIKNILYIIVGLDQGGLETYLLRYINYDHNNFHYVLTKSGNGGVLENEYKKRVVKLYHLKIGYIGLLSNYKLYKLIKNGHFDTVCDFTGNFAGVPLFISKLAKVKNRIAFYRGSSNHFKETFLKLTYNKFVKFLTFNYSTKILSNSQTALDYFYPDWKNNIHNKFKVIYNGINIKDFPRVDKIMLRKEFNIPINAFVIGHTGRFNIAKNHDTIIKVASTLCKIHKDIYFILIGKGLDEKYSDIIKKENLESNIYLFGYRNDIPRILYLFDLFYFPSITEGQPNSLIEAMICGLPFVASNIAPIKESIPENLHNLLLPALKYQAAIDVIEKLYLNRNLLKTYQCKDWAIEHYNANLLFNQFKQELEAQK